MMCLIVDVERPVRGEAHAPDGAEVRQPGRAVAMIDVARARRPATTTGPCAPRTSGAINTSTAARQIRDIYFLISNSANALVPSVNCSVRRQQAPAMLFCVFQM